MHDNGAPVTELPKWSRMARPQRTEARTEEARSPADDELLDCIVSSGWMYFMRVLTDHAKHAHRSLIAEHLDPAERNARQGGLAFCDKVLRETYKRAGLPYPEYLMGLLSGEIV